MSQKKDLPLPTYIKFLSEYDYNGRQSSFKRDGQTNYRTDICGFSDNKRVDVQQEKNNEPKLSEAKSSYQTGKDSNEVQNSKQDHKQGIVCPNCGEKGHIRPNFPNTNKHKHSNYAGTDSDNDRDCVVSGLVNGMKCPIDTGADLSIVSKDLVKDEHFTTELVSLKTFKNDPVTSARVAMITVNVLGPVFYV